MRKHDVFTVGMDVITRYRRRAAKVGIERVAKHLRKQGFPPEIAALILAPQSITTPERTIPCDTISPP